MFLGFNYIYPQLLSISSTQRMWLDDNKLFQYLFPQQIIFSLFQIVTLIEKYYSATCLYLEIIG